MAMPGYCMVALAAVVFVFGLRLFVLSSVVPALVLWVVSAIVAWLGVKMIRLHY